MDILIIILTAKVLIKNKIKIFILLLYIACDRRCGTCELNSTNCIIPCGDNCGYCDTTGKCIRCLMGYYLDSSR